MYPYFLRGLSFLFFFRFSGKSSESTFENIMTSSVDFVIERFLRAAFPPTIIAEIIALTATATSFPVTVSSPFVTLAVITTVHAPDNIPKISPITSLQTFDTISAFSTMYIAIFSLRPQCFERRLTSVSSAVAAAIPIPSKTTLPTIRNNNSTTITIRFPFDSVDSATKLKKADVKNVISVAFNAQCEFLTRPFRFRSRTLLSSPCFSTKVIMTADDVI